jgi:hypothetical protein
MPQAHLPSMRLLRTDKLEVVEFQGEDIPPYAILSHTWAEEEVSLQGVQQGLAESRRGYGKVAGACAIAVQDRFEYIVCNGSFWTLEYEPSLTTYK